MTVFDEVAADIREIYRLREEAKKAATGGDRARRLLAAANNLKDGLYRPGINRKAVDAMFAWYGEDSLKQADFFRSANGLAVALGMDRQFDMFDAQVRG